MLKCKIINRTRYEDLEKEVETFLAKIKNNYRDIKYSTTLGDRFYYSAMIIYEMQTEEERITWERRVEQLSEMVYGQINKE